MFGPEHGFRGTAQAGGSEGSYVDERTGLTVWDTYLKSGDALADIVRHPGVDTMVFDIQDGDDGGGIGDLTGVTFLHVRSRGGR